MSKVPRLRDGSTLSVGRHQIRVVSYLAEGGFSKIYRVRVEPPIESTVSEACLKQVIVPDKAALEVLRKEVEVMKSLRSGRNIVTLYDSNAERQDNGGYQVLMLMELCPNGSLLDYMNANIETKLKESEIVTIMLDIALAVYELHKRDLAHRDIKVENVLIDHQHRFKLCDFGSTASYQMPPKNLDEFRSATHDILYHTTQQYRAPEMIDLYRQLPVDDKADIWALGCFLYKLCYYITPFEATGDLLVLHALFQFYTQPVYLSEVKNLIIVMLQENPLFRPNIVQVLMLLAKMRGVDFGSLYVQDFYNSGPYNFHALSEYQMLKQKELVQQQQMYIQQNARKSNKRIIDPAQFQQFQQQQQQQPSHLLNDQLQANRTLPHLDAMVPNSRIPEKLQKQLHQMQLQNTPVPVQASHSVEKDGMAETKSVGEHHEADSDLDELTNIDNVEERFPLLDDFKLEPESTSPVGGGVDIASGTSSVNGVISPDKLLNGASEMSPEVSVKSQLNDGGKNASNKTETHPVIIEPNVAKLTAQNLATKGSRPDFASAFLSNSGKNNSLLMDDIFSNGSPLLKPQPQKTSQSVKSDSSRVLKWSTSAEDITLSTGKDDGIAFKTTELETQEQDWKVMGIKTPVESQPRKLSNENEIVSHKDANPWSNYRSTGAAPAPIPVSGPVSGPVPGPVPGAAPASLPRAVAGISGKPEELITDQLATLSVKEHKKELPLEQSLIDLEAEVAPQPQQRNKYVKEVQNSLLDIGTDFPSRNSSATSINLGAGDNNININTGRLQRRIGSGATPQSNLNLQEEVIDFESDNEESSEMNRLAIRNSLKRQSRKSSEFARDGGKRKESTERKRLSFFG